jgi:hypothetical protein
LATVDRPNTSLYAVLEASPLQRQREKKKEEEALHTALPPPPPLCSLSTHQDKVETRTLTSNAIEFYIYLWFIYSNLALGKPELNYFFRITNGEVLPSARTRP